MRRATPPSSVPAKGQKIKRRHEKKMTITLVPQSGEFAREFKEYQLKYPGPHPRDHVTLRPSKTLGFLFNFMRNRWLNGSGKPVIILSYKDKVWTSGTPFENMTVGEIYKSVGSPETFRVEYSFNLNDIPPPPRRDSILYDPSDLPPFDFEDLPDDSLFLDPYFQKKEDDDPLFLDPDADFPPIPDDPDFDIDLGLDKSEQDEYSLRLPSPLWEFDRSSSQEGASSKRHRIECKICFEKNKALYKCEQCKTAIYCSVQCQKKDWKASHKSSCSSSSSSSSSSGVGTQGTV